MLINCALTVQQICDFVFAYADCWLSDVAAYILIHFSGFQQINVNPNMFNQYYSADNILFPSTSTKATYVAGSWGGRGLKMICVRGSWQWCWWRGFCWSLPLLSDFHTITTPDWKIKVVSMCNSYTAFTLCSQRSRRPRFRQPLSKQDKREATQGNGIGKRSRLW